MDHPQPFLAHLDELRRRTIVVALTLGAATLLAYFGVDHLIAWMAGLTGGFVFTRMTEAFLVRIKLAMMGGLFLSIPVILFHFWRFVGRACEPSTRRWAMRALPVSYLLFLGGVACAWFAVLPTATKFLLGYGSAQLQPFLSIDAYVGFAGWLTLAFGALFQLPLVVFFLVATGVVSSEDLGHYRRHVIAGLVILAAAATPGPDIVSQLAVFLPTYLLYEASFWAARWWSPTPPSD